MTKDSKSKDGQAGDALVRLAPETKDRVRWVAGLLNATQAEVLELAMIQCIQRYDGEFQELSHHLARPDVDKTELSSLRELVLQP
ncbi:MAG: hypothetical protein QOD08_387 [Gaiellaceae bacterium]|nr:hypothetical protein [Gaiellaceae bacterium]